MQSMPVVLSGKWEWFAVNENHYKYSDLHAFVSFGPGPLIIDSWWFMILGNSLISLKLFWDDSQWFPNHSKNIFGVILDDSQWLVNQSEIILGWLLVIRKLLWKHFGVILSDLQTTLKTFLRQFLVIRKSVWNYFRAILSDSQWFMNYPENIFGAILNDSLINLKLFGAILSHPQTTLKTFWVILSDSRWFANQPEIVLRWFWGNLQTIFKWFVNHLESSCILINHTS